MHTAEREWGREGGAVTVAFFYKDESLKVDVTQDDLQQRFLAQHRNVEQCCNYLKQCRNNVATLCCTRNHFCESSSVTSP